MRHLITKPIGFVLGLSLIAAVTTPATHAHADPTAKPVYRETFPLPAEAASKLTDVGWQAWVYIPAERRLHRNAAGYTDLLRGKPSNPPNAKALNAETPPNPPATGMLINWNGGAFWLNPTLYFTEEFQLDNAAQLQQVQWFQNNQNDQGGFRIALRIGAAWYVSTQNFVGYGNRELALADARWLPLNAATLKPTDTDKPQPKLPHGPLTAFGVFGLHTGYAELDNFTLHATPPG